MSPNKKSYPKARSVRPPWVAIALTLPLRAGKVIHAFRNRGTIHAPQLADPSTWQETDSQVPQIE